jgi:hypothetical protein
MSSLEPLENPSQVTLSPADCSLDLGDGSERGEYVNQDHVLTTLGRPHRSINLMYCYYPFDKGWPERASDAHKPKDNKAWPYPYDDYFPFTGGLDGNREGPAFEQMRDVRRHGQEVTLTLTMDCVVPNDHIRVIAHQLRPFGRLRLRLNHECDGFWFSFNRRYSYTQVADFFVRFAGVFKKEAPEIKVMCCWGRVTDPKKGTLEHEKELSPILKAADLWSTDKYVTLDYAWPYKRTEPEHVWQNYSHESLENIWNQIKGIHHRFCVISGLKRGIEIGEFNADGNVGGEELQRDLMVSFYRRVLREKPSYLTGITYYQFRDRARLGLQREDPNNPQNGWPTPFLEDYRKIIQDPYFQPKESWKKLRGSLKTQWRSSEDSDGLGWKLSLKKRPIILELLLEKDQNLMIAAGNRWFYKKPGVEWVDLTTAAAEWGVKNPFMIRLFAPPASGENPSGASSVSGKLSQAPQLRLHYDWKIPSKKRPQP